MIVNTSFFNIVADDKSFSGCNFMGDAYFTHSNLKLVPTTVVYAIPVYGRKDDVSGNVSVVSVFLPGHLAASLTASVSGPAVIPSHGGLGN